MYSVIVVLIGAASLFLFWYMLTGFNIGKYSENTMIGSVYVGGLTEQEARSKVQSQVDEWLENDRVVFELRYQGYSYEFDRERFSFDIAGSVNNINDGRSNPLLVTYTELERAEVLFQIESMPFMTTIQDQFDLELVLEDILQDAVGMKTFSSKQLNDYIINEDNLYIQIHQSVMEVPAHINANDLITKIDDMYPEGLPLNEKAILSILDTFDERFSNTELSFLGSLFADIIPYTHFNIHHRDFLPQIDSSLYTLDTYPYFGRNVRVHRSQNIDFSFENNGFCRYRFEFELTGGFMILNLIGAPFLNEITVDSELIPIEHSVETVVNPEDVQEGLDGVIVFISRTIRDINDDIIRDEIVIFEYYPPVRAFQLSD